MREDDVLVLSTRSGSPSGLEIRINFGIFAGREATQAEIEEFAHALLETVPAVSIVSERRYEFGAEVEAAVHQVRVEVAGDGGYAMEQLLLDAAGSWARSCITARHADVSDF